MNSLVLRNLFILIPSFLAMLYGFIRVFPKTKGLYFRMATLAMACLFTGYLSSLVLNLTETPGYYDVNVSVLGSIGLCLFLMTQNADHVSSLLYEPGKNRTLIAVLPWLSPVVILLTFAFFEVTIFRQSYDLGTSFWFRTFGLLALCAILNAVTSYHTFRYALSPDEEGGLVSCLRPYNIAMTVLLVLFIPEQFLRNQTVTTTGGFIAMSFYYLVIAIDILAVLPLMERGRVKFLTSL